MIDPVHPEVSNPVYRVDSWSWRSAESGEHFRTCSFCGSIHPDDLVAEPLWDANWADMKYGWPHKFYASIPNRKPDTKFIISATNSATLRFNKDLEWVHVDEMGDEQRERIKSDGWSSDYTYYGFGKRTAHFSKFYTVHLNDPAISDETKQAIDRVSGIHFEFNDTLIKWSHIN